MNLWYNNHAADDDPGNLANWWQDAGCTIPATVLPDWSAAQRLIPIVAPTGQATGSMVVYNNLGAVAAGITICIRQQSVPDGDIEGHAYSDVIRSVVSDSAGLVTIAGLWRGVTYLIWRGNETPVEFEVPNQATFDLPTLLGDDAAYNVQQLGG